MVANAEDDSAVSTVGKWAQERRKNSSSNTIGDAGSPMTAPPRLVPRPPVTPPPLPLHLLYRNDPSEEDKDEDEGGGRFCTPPRTAPHTGGGRSPRPPSHQSGSYSARQRKLVAMPPQWQSPPVLTPEEKRAECLHLMLSARGANTSDPYLRQLRSPDPGETSEATPPSTRLLRSGSSFSGKRGPLPGYSPASAPATARGGTSHFCQQGGEGLLAGRNLMATLDLLDNPPPDPTSPGAVSPRRTTGLRANLEETRVQFEHHQKQITELLEQMDSILGVKKDKSGEAGGAAVDTVGTTGGRKETKGDMKLPDRELRERDPRDVPLLKKEDEWWRQARYKANVIPAKNPNTNDLLLKLQLLRLNPHLCQELQERADHWAEIIQEGKKVVGGEEIMQQNMEQARVSTPRGRRERIEMMAKEKREREAKVAAQKAKQDKAHTRQLLAAYRQRHPEEVPPTPEELRLRWKRRAWATLVAVASRVDTMSLHLRLHRQKVGMMDRRKKAVLKIETWWLERLNHRRAMRVMNVGQKIKRQAALYFKGLRQRMRVKGAFHIMSFFRDLESSNQIINTVLTYRRGVMILQKCWRSRMRIYEARRGLLLKQWQVYENHQRRIQMQLPFGVGGKRNSQHIEEGGRAPLGTSTNTRQRNSGSTGAPRPRPPATAPTSQPSSRRRIAGGVGPSGARGRRGGPGARGVTGQDQNEKKPRFVPVPADIKLKLVNDKLQKYKEAMAGRLEAWNQEMSSYNARMVLEDARMSVVKGGVRQKPPDRPMMQSMMKPEEVVRIHEKGCKMRDADIEAELKKIGDYADPFGELKNIKKQIVDKEGHSSTEVLFKGL